MVNSLTEYRRQALKLAKVKLLGGDEGYLATIPGFRGLLAVGGTEKKALVELQSALEDWTNLALKRGIGLPRLATKKAELIPT